MDIANVAEKAKRDRLMREKARLDAQIDAIEHKESNRRKHKRHRTAREQAGRDRFLAGRIAEQKGISVDTALAQLLARRAEKAAVGAAHVSNRQATTDVAPEPPADVLAGSKSDSRPSPQPASQPTVSNEVPLVDDSGAPLTEREISLMMSSAGGRTIPLPTPQPVEMPATGFPLDNRHPDFLPPAQPVRDPHACPNCRPGYRAPSCTGACEAWGWN